MTYKEFIDYLYEAVNCEGYIDRESEYIQTIEEVVGIDFKCLTNEEIFALIQGMRIMYEMERESWRYFEEEGEEDDEEFREVEI